VTRPPEYEQVAEWLNVIKDATGTGLTIGTSTGEQRQALAERARRALGGIDLDGKSTAQIAGEYHASQIAGCAQYERDLLERIRALKSGDFTVPRWYAEDAAGDGMSVAEVVEWYRNDEIQAASDELDHLDCYYEVRDDEIQAYWARRASRLSGDCPGDGRPAAGGRPGQDARAPGAILDFPNGPLPDGPGLMSARAACRPHPQVTRQARVRRG
jgi:hypothetical protein